MRIMEILATFVRKLLDFTLVPVARHFGYVIFYNKSIEGVRKEAGNLEATREDVKTLVDAARNNNEEISAVVQRWQCGVDVIMEKADKFFREEGHANTGCSQNSCPNLWLRYKLSRKANKMASEVGELVKEREKFDKVETGRKPPDFSGPSSVVKEAFESRVATRNQIMEQLADSTIRVIGLYGLGGVGKTTLAKQVAHKAQEEKKFDKVLTVDVKQNYSIRDIQSQIAVKLGLEFGKQDESEGTRAGVLRSRLKQENSSLLIVLDDLWERLDLEEVGIAPTGEVNPQCKFILTSRGVDLLSCQMNCDRVIEVRLLSEEEAWLLFKDKAAINEHSDDPALLSTATQVFQKCARLPIAIVTVASTLKNKKILKVWNDALEQLKNYSSPERSITDEAYSSIKLSYKHLKGEALKSTFLLSAMFSQDPLHEELFMYAMGLGFLEGVGNMKAAQDRLVARVRELKGFSLLLDSGSEDRFTMHDVVRDVALSIAFEERHALVKRHGNADNWLDEYKRESCSAICFYKSDIDWLPEVLHGPKVEFFYLNSKDPKLNMPSDFFKGMQDVKVLSLSNVTCSPLPSSMNLLNKLITLSLHSCTLEDIAVVGHLKELKILNLSKSTIKQLPREVGQLSSLKILNLSHCDQLGVIRPNILSKLTKLEELYMRRSFDRWEAEGLNEGKERASLDELKNLLKLRALEIHIPDASVLPKELFVENSLERYDISIGTDDRWFYFSEFSKVLTLVPNNNINMEYGVFRLFKGVEELTLENLNGEASLYQSHNTTETFRELRAIRVRRCDQLKFLFSVSMFKMLGPLERIEISECKSLEEIVAFEGAENVEKGPPMNVIEFHRLRSLELNDLPALTSDVCFNDKVVFPNLETLILRSINCKYIWDMSTPESRGTHWSKLQKIEVRNCDELKSLLPVFMVGILSGLEGIKVSECKSLEEIVTFANHENVERGSAMNVAEFLKLRSLVLEGLPTLTGSCFDNKVVFPNLQTLILTSINCKYIWDMSTPVSGGTHRSKLQKILVRNCDELKSLFPVFMVGIFSGLKGIYVDNCKSLEEIVAFANHENLKKGSAMNVVEFLQLRSLVLNDLPALTGSCFDNKVVFPNLETLILGNVNCKYIWDMSTPEISGAHRSKLQNIEVRNCEQLKSLFPVFMVGILSGLEGIYVYNCKSLEKIVAFANHENVEKGSAMNVVEFLQLRYLELKDLPALTGYCFDNKVAFPKLETLYLTRVGCRNIWDVHTSIGTGTQITEIVESSQVRAVSCSNLKTLRVENCKFLLKLIPLHILKSLSKLEELEIIYCASLEVIFDLGECSDYKETHTFPLKTLHLKNLLKLKTVCSKGFQGIVSFQRLQKLVIVSCNKLEADEEVFHVEELHSNGRLDKMMWNGVFRAYDLSNVKFLSLGGIYDDEEATFPYSLFYRFPKLEELQVMSSSFLVIFSSPERPFDNDARKVTSIKKLELRLMEKLKHIWDGKRQLDPILQNLKALEVYFCQRLINLGPSFVSLENLTELDVSNCDGMINLLTSSTAKTLVQLTSLKIQCCEKMEEVITNAEGDVENEIVFVKLKTLELDELTSCKSFCGHNHKFNFPSLDEVSIEQCPKLEIFCQGILTTPLLKSNLNKTVQELFEEGLLFANAEVKIDEYPKLKDVWIGKLAPYRSCNMLTSLIMDKCDFLACHAIPSYVLTSLFKLKKLRVSNCDSVEVIFDLEGIDIDKEAEALQAIPLERLELDHLPNLKYVWNKGPQTIICFQRLTVMRAHECERLRSIFPASIAKGLIILLSLNIESCGVEAIVAEDHTESSTIHFVFPKLRWLHLVKLPNLKNFFPQKHIVEWPKLETMDVWQCEKLKVYGWADPEIGEKEAESRVENQYPLILSEKVVPNLRKLVLNQNHFKMIVNNQHQNDLFNRVSDLVLDNFSENDPSVLLNTVQKRFSQLSKLTVSSCHHLSYLFSISTAKSLVNLWSLEIEDCKIMGEIVTNDDKHAEDTIVFTKLRVMKLIDLPMLESFCIKTCTFEFPSLKYVTIKGCFEMKMFCPGALVTPLLEEVKVEKNEERWEGNLNNTLEQLFLEKGGQNSLEG